MKGNWVIVVIKVIEVIRVHALITLITLITSALAISQPGTIALGLEYKPIFPVSFLHTGAQTATESGIDYQVSLTSGFNGGMVIRKNFTKLLTFETGINYIQRKYNISITDSSHSEGSAFHIIGYEIPVSLLIYAQTGEKTFLNVSMGISADMFASNVQTAGENHRSYTVRHHTIQPALIANVGWEYRTETSGYFYLGASYHGPFNDDFTCYIAYNQNGYEHDVYIPLSGNYLTIDFRFFFPPDTKGKKNKSEPVD